MSISSLNISNQTGLVPQTLLGYSSNGVSAIEITPTSITLGGDLNTTPIYVEVSASTGLTTNRVGGLNVNCNFDMNGNEITECSTVSNNQGNITISSVSDDVNLSAGGGAICSITAGTTNISANDLLTITGTTGVYIEGTNDLISLSSANGVYINDTGGSGGNGNIYANNFFGTASSASFANSATNSDNILITTDNTSGTYYIPFSKTSGTGNKALFQDDITTPLTYNPNTSTLSATNFSGLSTNATNATNAVNCSTTSTTTAGTYYPVFVSSNITGNYPNLVGVMTYNPSTNTITANTFNGALSGTATNSTNASITSDNTSGTYYIPFTKTSGTGNKPLFQDDTTGPLTYNPSTGNMSAISYTITGTPSTASVASTFGQVGLVYLSTSQFSIVGSASAQTISLASIFNSTYQNYRIVLNSATQVSFTAYPNYSLAGYLGTSVPTTGSLYGNELTSASSSSIVAVYTAGATLSSSPLQFAVSSLTNKQVVIEIENVGFANTASQVVGLKCKSFYGNPGVSGYSDRNILSTSLSGATITGLSIQQSSLGVGNNMTLQAVVYGYNTI